MIYTPDMIGKRGHDCINGRKWALRHMQDRYGSGNCKDVLKLFCKLAQERYPRKRNTNYFYIISWTDNEDITYENIAEVLNEAVQRHESDISVA